MLGPISYGLLEAWIVDVCIDNNAQDEINQLRAKARYFYKEYWAFRVFVNQGVVGASADVERNRVGFNGILDRLAMIDPTAPKERL